MSDWFFLGGEQTESRRVKSIPVDLSLLSEILGVGIPAGIYADEPIADLKIIAMRLDAWTNCAEFLVHSESFEIVPPGCAPFSWRPSYTRHYKEVVPA